MSSIWCRWFGIGCPPPTLIPPTPIPVLPPALARIVFHVQDTQGVPLKGTHLSATSPNGPWQGLTDIAGDFVAKLAPGHYEITFTLTGYRVRVLPADLVDPGTITVGLELDAIPFPANLREWKGAFCIPNGLPGSPYGDGKRIWTPSYGVYDDVWRAEILSHYKSRGYTHFVYNIASPDGVYHNDYPALADDPVRARRDLTEILTAGLIPVVAACNDANGGMTVPYESISACATLIPIVFPMWEMNGPLGVDVMKNGQSVGRIADAILNTRAAAPNALCYIHFTAGHGAGAEPEGDWWQWAARQGVVGLLSQDDHWNDPANTAAGLADTARHLHGKIAGWEGLTLDNVAFELQTTALYHEGRTEQAGFDFMRQVLPHAGEIAGFCDSASL